MVKLKLREISIAVIVVAILLFFAYSYFTSGSAPSETAKPACAGCDKDSHGCIGSAGFTWCEAKQKCLRTWEENCTTPVACTQEAKLCPDGSAVGRTGPDCEFAPCPG